MFRILSCLSFALVLSAFSGYAAFSMDAASDEECAQRVQKVCGDGSVAKCFEDNSKWSKVGSDCEGAVQTLIENENDANGQGAAQVTAAGMDGVAYGGKLRKGPAMDTPKIASVILGDKIKVLEDSGVWMNDYKWFKVKTPRGTGYLWGGIFCVPGDVLPEGVFDNCQLLKQQ